MTFKGKTYCPKCYNKAIKEAESAEQELEELVEFIKELFGLTEFPPEWLEQIQAYHKEKKTLRGMQAPLYYYYMILGNIPDVAGENDGFFHTCFPQRKPDHGGAQKMPRVEKFGAYTGADLKRLAVIICL